MMKDVLIKIKGIQGLDGEKETVELTTTGRYGMRNGEYLVAYAEDGVAGSGRIKTSLRIKKDGSVNLIRTGGINSRLTVQKGVRNVCLYGTPYGDMQIGIYGETFDNNLSSNGGSFAMSYTIDSNLQLVSRNIVEILIKEVNDNVDNCIGS